MKVGIGKKCTNLVILIVLIASFSCTKEERNTVIKNELTKNNPQIEVTTSNEEVKPKYIINRHSGKVHIFTHGMNCGMERTQ